MKTVVGYVRVSTNGQAQEDKYGIEAQKRDILDYCAKHDLALTKWYVDGGVSGVEEQRPELDKILFNDEEVGNPPIQAVIVAKSDRLARDMNLYYYYKFVLKKKNIELISVSEDFGAMGAFAGVLESLTLFIAEQERINIAKRTSSGRRMKARAGGYAGGRAPYGYRV
ncbi:MAG: recombinase family protein, partial [Bacillota bacterium]|nr:recombinase family protein [Bacillota bacterium]